MEIFRWLLRNRMNEADIDGAEAKVSKPHYLELGGSMASPKLKDTNKSNLFIPFGGIFKVRRQRQQGETSPGIS